MKIISIFILIIVLLLFGSLDGLSQDLRGFYSQKFIDRKRMIDSLSKASLGTVGSIIGYTLDEPYVGIFPIDVTVREMNMTMRERSFQKGDTFYIRTITYPRFNYGMYAANKSIQYHTSNFEPADCLLRKEEFDIHAKKIKALDIDYILPLWGLIYCNDIDDYGADNKAEKWWVKTESHDLYIKVEREQDRYSLTIAMDLSADQNGNLITYLGCAIPNTSYIKLNYSDGNVIKQYHIGEDENCMNIRIDITDHYESMQMTLKSIELSLSKGKKLFKINSKMQGDVLALKCDCID